MVLQNRTILLLSPQAWGAMFVSKHHYALELARRGNRVYFLNPPSPSRLGKGRVTVRPVAEQPGLFLIDHRLFFPYNLRFHAGWLFHALMRFHLRNILKTIGRPVDLVWSFDTNNLYPLRFFPAGSFKIFHPMDEPRNRHALQAADNADVILTVTPEIQNQYSHLSVNTHVVAHGLAEVFLDKTVDSTQANGPVRVGMSGNWLRSFTDYATLLSIVRRHTEVIFECWGSYRPEDANLGNDCPPETLDSIQALRAQPNLRLHGPVPTAVLARELHRMDAFLICYDVQKDQSRGTNYHKILEYLSTGKVIVANNISNYQHQPDLVQMVASRTDNQELPELFNQVIAKLDFYNAPVLQEKRLNFARRHSYSSQLDRIEKFILAHRAQ